MDNLFAVCSPGLEPFMARELHHLGLAVDVSSSWSRPPASREEFGDEVGGVEFRGSLRDVYLANLHLRTASRVLVRLGSFYATVFPELRRKASRLPWERYLVPGRPVALRVTCHRSRLYHQGAVADRVAAAIGDRLGRPPAVQRWNHQSEANLPQLILVRLLEDHCGISVDTSGPLLHRRGYRLATAKAPLRETLAAGILLASGWDTVTPLLDPFCGSGTIPIEAARMARGIPPGRGRQFAFMEWPGFERSTWKKLLAEAERRERTSLPLIVASDRDAGAIRTAHENAERAGVAESIEFSRCTISGIKPPSEAGWVVTNPPYGLRIGANKDLRNLYARFGEVLRIKCPRWHVAVLCHRGQLLRSLGLKVEGDIPLRNGGLRVRLMLGKVDPEPFGRARVEGKPRH